MKLWLIQQEENNGYDTYDAAIVAAETEEDAKRIHPGGHDLLGDIWEADTWCSSPDKVKATCVGTAGALVERGAILSSFNAG